MLAAEQSRLLAAEQAPSGKWFGLFRPPAESVMTLPKLSELQRRLYQLRILISAENRTDKPGSVERLAKFVMLNPHASDYAQHLDGLLEQTEDGDRLRDNILLAQAKLIADEQLRAEKLSELHKECSQTDAGLLALYELGLLKISLWRQQDESNLELKKKRLEEAKATLSSFISLYPTSFYAEQVKKNLDGLPAT
jgi:outer membrane protein assembly factor BamD (BamD/ComL family)